ncbi:MAG: hypothetical protein HYV97_14020 [Bdellovibrio sp.]|nr:hypothetical protein [Bdellovibrio sp.]
MSQILGFVGQDNKGLSGSEYFFDTKLKGKPHVIRFVKDAKGRPLKTTSIDPGDPGTGLQLSFDLEVQANSEKQLREAVIEHGAKMGGIGVMDAETGEILAMANYPSYDPNRPNELNRKFQRLAFITDPIEPGSIAKTFTIAAAMESGLTTATKKYFCERGQLRIGDHIINEAESKKKFEWLTVTEILEHSSNIGTTKIAFELGSPRLLYFFDKFGLGKKSGIEYAGESRGIMPAINEVTPLRLSNISFGQGMAVTPIQILSAYAIIANGGTYVRPTILKANAQAPGMRVLSKETVTSITRMLADAVEKGTGANAKIPLFKIAGKTSTTQRPSENGGYHGYIPGFIGFPVQTAKKYVVYVYIDNPTGKKYYGNDVAAPVFKKVMEHILIRDKMFINVADAKSNSKSVTQDLVVRNQSALSDTGRVLPNFTGLDKQSVETLITKLPLKIRHHGVGLVIKQGPPAGTLFTDSVTEVDLYYEPPTIE